MAEAGDTNIKQSVEGEGNTSNLPSEGAALGAPAQASAVQETEGAALGAPEELDPEVAKTAARGSSPSGLPLEELPVATEEPALSESQPTISVDGREAAEGAPDPPDEDFEDVVEETPPTETKEEVFEDLPEEVEELEGCTSALAEEKTEVEPVEALDHVMAKVQGNTQSAPGSEEDTLLTVAALTIGVAFSDTSADIDVLYSHVAATLHIDVSQAMRKVDARAADIDQLQSRTYSVDPVEYLWPGARESVESLVTNLSPQLAAANEDLFEEVVVDVEEPPVPPQDIVGGQQLPQGPATPPKAEPAAKRAASAPEAKPHRRGSRAGRYRQERWAKKDWRTQVELIQEFIWNYLGHVRIHYTSWWDTPESARELIDGFYLRGAQENEEEAFSDLAKAIPPIRDACRYYGYHPSTHYVAGGRVRPKAKSRAAKRAASAPEAKSAPRQPPEPPTPARKVVEEASASGSADPAPEPARVVTIEDPKPQETVNPGEERAASKAPEQERAAPKAPEQSALQRAAAVGEFAADSSPRQRFDRILTSIRSLHFIGFQGTEGIISAACQVVHPGNWTGTYRDGRRPRLTGQPELDEAEALLLDNAVLEYLRTQYKIQVDSSLKASSLDWERETRGRQVHPSTHNPRGLRSRSIGAEGDRSRTPAGPARESPDQSKVSLLSKPTILRPATPGYPTIRIDGEGWWQKIAEREATEIRSGKARAHPDDPEKWVDISRAVEGVTRVPRHFFDEDPDPQPESTEELNVPFDESDPEWQAELEKLRRTFIAGRAKASLPTVPEASSASGTGAEWAAVGAQKGATSISGYPASTGTGSNSPGYQDCNGAAESSGDLGTSRRQGVIGTKAEELQHWLRPAGPILEPVERAATGARRPRRRGCSEEAAPGAGTHAATSTATA